MPKKIARDERDTRYLLDEAHQVRDDSVSIKVPETLTDLNLFVSLVVSTQTVSDQTGTLPSKIPVTPKKVIKGLIF